MRGSVGWKELLLVAPQNGLALHAEDPQELLVHELITALPILEEHHGRGPIEDGAQAHLALAQTIFRTLAVADVVHGESRGEDVAGRIGDRRKANENVNGASFTGQGFRLDARARLAATDTREELFGQRRLIGRYQPLYRRAHHFRGAVPEDAHGTLVPRRYHSVDRATHDALVGTLDDGGQPSPGFLSVLAFRNETNFVRQRLSLRAPQCLDAGAQR